MSHRTREWLVAAALIGCLGILGLWQAAAFISSKKTPPLQVKAADFKGFMPLSDGWSVAQLPVGSDPLEPNILVYRLLPDGPATNGAVLVRLVHGYNMRDCLRIKGYAVTLLRNVASGIIGKTALSGRLEAWRVVAADGRVSVWCTRMIRAYDFSPTSDSVTSMAFPKVGTPDDANWVPRGLSWRSFRHPVRNSRVFLRSKWNSSRCDLLTFLGLRRPAWASDELLTVVGVSVGPSVPPENEQRAVEAVCGTMDLVLTQLQQWRSSRKE